ncbi:MAG TPA: hypothetical protein PKD54_13350 [Pirellulaceae bacterium]|nr:hypothetical protein [Pirellulaceae bacterium]
MNRRDPRSSNAQRRATVAAIAKLAAATLLIVWGATNLFNFFLHLIRMQRDDPGWGNWYLGAMVVLGFSVALLVWGGWLLRRL